MALGVTILIVVMSVMDGFEVEVKKRLLAFSPHISLRYAPDGQYIAAENWQEVAEQVRKHPGVKEVSGNIDDHAIIGTAGSQLPISYRGIDTTDPDQVAALSNLLTDDYGTSTADMGLETQAIMLESRARQLGVTVGDVVQLYSTRNLDSVFAAYQKTERPRASEEFQQDLSNVMRILKENRIAGKPGETYLAEHLKTIFNGLISIQETGIRDGEFQVIDKVLDILDKDEVVDETHSQLPAGSTALIEQYLLKDLSEVDNTADDNAELKKLKEIILPQDVKIVGVYRISQQVVAPDFFMPIPLAQELSGLESGVHAISIRLHDADTADLVSQELISQIDDHWYPTTWMYQYGDFFKIVEMQEGMMALVLSIVSVGAAFLITIVMFLTALQKKKEIGVMLAVGARPGQICMVFFIQGIIIGVIGVILGVISGLAILRFRGQIQNGLNSIGFDIFNAQFTGMESLPAHTTPTLLIWVSGLALLLCALAPLLPAIFAARNDPAKSLRDL